MSGFRCVQYSAVFAHLIEDFLIVPDVILSKERIRSNTACERDSEQNIKIPGEVSFESSPGGMIDICR